MPQKQAAAKGGASVLIRAHNFGKGCAFAKKPATKAAGVIKIVFIVLHIRSRELENLTANRSICLRLVQIIARRKFGVFFKMVRLKRFR